MPKSFLSLGVHAHLKISVCLFYLFTGNLPTKRQLLGSTDKNYFTGIEGLCFCVVSLCKYKKKMTENKYLVICGVQNLLTKYALIQRYTGNFI